MDPNLIYVKTSSGEDAIQQRTRVIQRNVRMVLILVDGQSTVADLSRKTGNPQLTENALAELEKGGFIVPKVEQHDSLWEESKRVALAIRTAALNNAARFSSPEKKENYPDFQHSLPADASQERSGPMTGMPISMHSMFDAAPSVIDFSASQFSIAPDGPGALKGTSQVAEKVSAEAAPRRLQRDKTSEPAPRPSFFSQIRALWAGAKRDLDEERVEIKTVRRGARRRIAWPVAVMLLFIGTIGAVFLASLVFPYGIFLQQVETVFAQSVGQPVKVGALRVELYPEQVLILDRVRIAEGKAGGDAFSVRDIRLHPDVMSLFAERLNFRRAVLSGLELPLGSIARLPGMFSTLENPANRVGVERISLEKAEMSFGGIVFSDVEAEIQRDQGGAFGSLLIRSADRSFSVLARPVGGILDLAVEAFAWRPFSSAKVSFDSANMKGRLENGVLTLRELDLRVFDGVVRGSVALRTGEKPTVEGDIAFERIEFARLGDALGVGKRLQGAVAGKMRFSAASVDWAAFWASLNAEGEFSAARGSMAGVDLAEAIRRTSGTPVQGGTTAFEQLSGRIRLTPDRTRFYGLLMNSGLMYSSGQLDVSKDRNLSGRLELQMRGSVNQTRVPVSIGGTIDAPSVRAGAN